MLWDYVFSQQRGPKIRGMNVCSVRNGVFVAHPRCTLDQGGFPDNRRDSPKQS